MATLYPGLFNSSYVPTFAEVNYLERPEAFLGPWLMAASLCLLLEGITLCQLFEYLVAYQTTDRLLIRAYVYVTTILCSAKAGHAIYISWNLLVQDFGNYLLASTATPSIKLTALEASIIGAIVQSFYIHRTFTLSRNWLFIGFTVPTLLLGLTGSLIVTILVFDPKLLMANISLLNPAAYMMVSSIVICDVFITGFTAHYLLKTRTAFAETNSLIARLLKTAIQSAVPPTTCAIINLALNSQAAKHAWVNLFNSLMPFLYTISMLYTLNSRMDLKRGPNDPGSSNGIELASRSKLAFATRPEVYVTHQTEVDIDSNSFSHIKSRRGDLDNSKHNVVSLSHTSDDVSEGYKASAV